MAANREDLKWTNLRENLGYGARSNKYLVELVPPTGATIPVAGGSAIDFKGGSQVYALCKGANVPARTTGVAEVWIQGRKIPIPGDATFEGTITLTFWNDQKHDLRKMFERWIENLDSYNQHQRGFNPSNYYVDKVRLSQLDPQKQVEVCAVWEFYHVFPTNISAVDFGAEKQNEVSEFSCEFTYAHYNRIQ